MKFAASYSFGKDSALALWRMKCAGHEPVCLITTVNEEAGRSWFHGIDHNLMDAVSDSMGIPLIKCICSGENYHTEFDKCLQQAHRMGAEACVFGDIDIEGHLEWNSERCAAAGLNCVVPLWHENRESVVYEMIDAGFNAVIKCVQSEFLDDSFLGMEITRDLIEKIRLTGADICGENGEYHTFVRGGPLFKNQVEIELGDILDLGSHSAIDIRTRSIV